ncbi:MAG: hypothetical protein U1E40_16515 [Amaricoccus sp.]
MLRSLVMLAAAGALLAACASTTAAPVVQTGAVPAALPAEKLQSCDDGGEGGVVIHGVCL